MPNNYYDKRVREICHGVKERDLVAIKEMAQYFLNLDVIEKQSILIPAPQHEGYAIYTRQIADIISEQTGCRVADVIKSSPRETLYRMKKTNLKKPLGFILDKEVAGYNLFFIDNVLDTGMTFCEANKLFGGRLQPMVYAATHLT